MRCAYCDSEIENKTRVCPHCGATVAYTEPDPTPEKIFIDETVPRIKRKTNKFSLVFACILIAIPFFLSLFMAIDAASVKSRSSRTSAVLVESNRQYTEVERKSRKSGKSRRRYYELEVHQHLVVEYDLGEGARIFDLGVQEVFSVESSSDFTQTERDNYLASTTLDIGDTLEVYVTKDGTVHLADKIDGQGRGATVASVLTGALLVFLVLRMVKGWKRQ